MAENSEIPNAESIKPDYMFNCDIVFTGENLLLFLREHYPDKVQDIADKVVPDGKYTLYCFDFS